MAYLVDNSATRLELFRVKESTLKVYKKAVSKFVIWCEGSSSALDALCFDDLLYAYLVTLFGNGASKSSAMYTFYGLLLFDPSLKSQLHLSHAALLGWNALKQSVSWPPLPFPIMVAMSCSLCKGGSWLAGVGLVVAFHSLLRVSELCSLEVDDVIFSDHPVIRGKNAMALQLSFTKTGRHQFVLVSDPDAMVLLAAAVVDARNTGRATVFPFSPDRFRAYMRAATTALGLQSFGYVPHSLRHGGATYAYLCGVPIEDILVRGRWRSNNSVRTYLQGGRALLSLQALPQRVVSMGERLAKSLSGFFSKHVPTVKSVLAF